MIPVKSSFPPGMIGVVSSDMSRFPEFSQALLRLQVPEGTVWSWIQGNGLALNRNVIVDKFINNEPRLEWLWFIDDDHDFDADILRWMLKASKPILQPMVCTRKPPYYPYTYKTCTDGRPGYVTDSWDDLPTSGLLECDAVGTGGMLIQREVLEQVGYPWFEEGKTTAEAIGEDLFFCKKAKKLGFSCWIDLDHSMEHYSKVSVRPVVKDGKWKLEFNMGHGAGIVMPADFAHDLAVEDAASLDYERRQRYELAAR